MLVRRAIVFSVALLLMLCVSLPARATGEFGGSGKFVGWWELGGYYGTDDSSRGEVVLFTPLMQSATTLFFLDARGKFFEEDVQEANLAFGYRQMMPSGWNLGLWAGWDIRDTGENNTFHQVSFGLEALSERFDVRVNGYVPVTDPKGSPGLAEVVLRGNNILMIGGEEVPLYGVDGEVGVLLFGRNRGGGGGLKGAPSRAKRHELRAYAGGFWFDADEALEEVAGPKGRLEYRINDVISSLPGSRLTIESELSYDEVRDTKFEIGARLRIPFGARGSDAASRVASLTGQELRMIEGLERDTDIITVQSEEENVFDDATNVAMNAVSFASNAAGFSNAVDAGGNRLIILQDGGAQIDVSGTDGQQLQNNQTVQGGASTLNYRGAKSGTVAPFRAPGSRPTLFTNDTNNATGTITLASNTHVAGVNIRGVGDSTTFVGGNHGIFGVNNLSNVVIEQMDIRNMGDEGVRFNDNNSQVIVSGNTISNIGDDNVRFFDNNTNVTVSGNAISDTRADSVEFGSGNINVTVWSNTIANTGGHGVDFSATNSNVTVSGNAITNTGNQGVNFGGNNSNVTISGNTIENVDDDGVRFVSGNSNFTVSGNTIVNTGGDGVRLFGNNTNVTLSDNIFTAIGNGGVSDDVFDFEAAGTTLAPGSTGNVVTTAPNAGVICRGQNNFTGTLEVTDQNGVVQTFVNAATCPP